MKESAMTALSFVKSKAKQYNIDEDLFNNNDFHVHVPEGAIPKDGPSAGITMATAIYSAATQRLIKKEVGMTGEITLRGYVLPIGGLKEKLMAAYRARMKKVLIPLANKRDLDKVPEEIKSKLEFVFVENISEVLEEALIQGDGEEC